MKLRFLSALLSLCVLTLCARAQDIRITEFLAANTSGIQDEDGTFQGWIELWNPSTLNSYSLSGWVLTDGTNSWTFPAVTMSTGDRMLIWASGKNRTVVTAPLHTNFTLNKAGGTLKLLRPDTTISSQFAPYPAQSNNKSYGRDFVDTAMVGVYSTPTPNDVNNFSGSGVSGKVNFLDASNNALTSKTYTGSLSVTLKEASPVAGAVIHYTVDNTEPLSTSPTYTAPITITATTQLRARVYAPGLLPGQISSNCYLLLDSTTVNFTSAMPIVVITDFNAGTPVDGSGNPNYNTGYMWTFQPGTDGLAHLSAAPTIVTRVGLHRHGSTTLGNAKYNLKLETRRDRDDEDSDVALLNMPADSDWIFSGPYTIDPSLLHNPLISAMSNTMGRYAPRSVQAEVFMDVHGGALTITSNASSSSNDYYGVYNVEEEIHRGSDRVDIAKIADLESDPVRVTGGYLFKIDRRDTNEVGFTTAHEGSFCYSYPKEENILKPQNAVQKTWFLNYLTAFDTLLYSTNYKDPVNGYRKNFDVAAAIDFHIVNTWAFNTDGLRLSTYLYKDQGGKIVFGPTWDFDRALSSTDGRDANPLVWSVAGATDFFSFDWWSKLFTDSEFFQQYIDRWQELRRGVFSQTNMNTMIDQLNASVSSDAVARDLGRWNNAKRSWTSPFTSTVYPASQAAEVQRLKDWLQQRANFFDTYFVAPVTTSIAAGNVAANTQVTLTAASGSTIYYTLDGSDPRPSGGAAPANPSAIVHTYSGPITISSTQRIRARAYNPSWTTATGSNNPRLISKWSGLTDARFSTDTPAYPGSLAVTEVNYHPTDPTSSELAVDPTYTDSDFEYIELKNITNTTLDLANLAFTQGITMTFTGNNAISLAPGAFVVIAGNPTAFALRYGTVANVLGPYSGDLSNSGEEITLVSATSQTLIDFTYADSWYPTTDGGGHSLAVYNSLAPSAAFSTAANWRASITSGSPGADEPNLAPVLNLAATATTYLPGLTLTGTADDDSLPTAPLTFAWAQTAGPGTATFAAPAAVSSGVTFSLPGTYTLSLTANDGALQTSKSVTVTAVDTPEAWLTRYPSIGTLTDNPTHDGVSNFAKWALMLDPTVNMPAPITVTLPSGALSLTYHRPKNPTVTYTVQVSSDLITWHDSTTGDVLQTVTFDDGVTQTVLATDTFANTTRRFLRLIISRP